MQAINSAILDVRPNWRKHESLVILGICVTGWILAVPMVLDGGIYLYSLMDWNTASWAVLLIGFAEVILPAWCYGCDKFLGNIAEMQMAFGRILRGYWWLSWMVLAPISALVSTCYALSISNKISYASPFTHTSISLSIYGTHLYTSFSLIPILHVFVPFKAILLHMASLLSKPL